MANAGLNTVAAEWEKFKAVIPTGASETQFREMRRAFFAGGASMFKLVTDTSELSDDGAEAVFDGLSDELRSYAATIGTPLEGR